MKATLSQLKEIALFQPLSPDTLAFLKPHTRIRQYQSNEIIIHEGETFPPQLHLVLTGSLLIKKVSATGKETILRQLPSGEMFAAPALFGDRTAPATVIATEPSDILFIQKSALLQAIQTEPELALQILRCFNQRLQTLHKTVHGLVSERAIVRLIRLIQYTAKCQGTTPTATGHRLNINLPYQQMARTVGITYEECVRLINKEIKPAIEYKRGGIITIQAPKQLTAIVKAQEA